MKRLIPFISTLMLGAAALYVSMPDDAQARVIIGGGVIVGGAPYYAYPPYYGYPYYAYPAYPYPAYPAYPPAPAPAPAYYSAPAPAPTDHYYQTPEGQYCREYRHTVVIEGQKQTAFGHACREPDGTWHIID